MSLNITKVWFFIFFSSLIFLILGYELAQRMGLLLGLSLALVMNFFLFFFGESRLLEKFKAQELKGQDPWGLQSLLEKYCTQLSISRPALYSYEDETASAFSLGLPWGKSNTKVHRPGLSPETDWPPRSTAKLLAHKKDLSAAGSDVPMWRPPRNRIAVHRRKSRHRVPPPTRPDGSAPETD